MSTVMNKDAEAYDREHDAFLKQLEDFHHQRGTPFKRLPRVNGKGIDLYLLYVVVTARGGWLKVNARNEWDEILEDFRLPPSCVNSATALKHVYIRYLDAYERVNFLGEDGDERTSEMEDDESRSMRGRRSARALNIVPLSYNHQQHNIPESLRASAGMSTDLFKPSPYDRLSLSLQTPIPNENDFALNVCTVLSNEGRHVMRIPLLPRIIDNLTAHAGVFRDWETQKYFLHTYKEAKNRSLMQFWLDSVERKPTLELLVPKMHEKASEKAHQKDELNKEQLDKSLESISSDQENVSPEKLLNQKETEEKENIEEVDKQQGSDHDEQTPKSEQKVVKDIVEKDVMAPFSREDTLVTKLKKILECERTELKLNDDDGDILHLGRDLGTLDMEGTRISQVLSIIRNLSFEEVNVQPLATSETCLRFLVLCMCSNWGGLAVNALDTLGNIAPEVVLQNPVDHCLTSFLLSTICQGAGSDDRAYVLRSLEVLNKLAMNDPNEEILNRFIEQLVYDQICRYLTIHDIMLLIYTLECLYSLSSLGTPACNSIVRAKGCVHTLISLLTVEAQSYGPEACIGMKVVETVTGIVSEPEPAPSNPSSTNTTTSNNTSAANSSSSIPPQPASIVSVAASPAAPPPPPSPQVGQPATVASGTMAPPPAVTTTPITPKTSVKGTPTEPKKLAGRVVLPEVEEFVMEWVTSHYEACPGNAMEQAVVYRHFAASMHSMGRKQGLNPVLLSNCVRKVFGTGVGPSRRPVDDGIEKWHYNGIKRKEGVVVPPMPDKKRRIPVVTPTPPATPVVNSSTNNSLRMMVGMPVNSTAGTPPPPGSTTPSASSILKAQLSAPPRQMTQSPPRSTPVGLAGSHLSQTLYSSPQHSQSSQPHMQQHQQHQAKTENSALIKSLLASKVTPMGSGQHGSMDSANPLTHPHPPPSQYQQQQQQQQQQQHQQQQQQQPPPPPPPYLAPPQATSGNTLSHVQASGPRPSGSYGTHSTPVRSASSGSIRLGQSTGQEFQVVAEGQPMLQPQAMQVSRNIQRQQQVVFYDSSQDSNSESQSRKPTSFNGICSEFKKTEDDSSSLLPSTLNENKKVISFEGILQNGVKSEMEESLDGSDTVGKKNVLADLLEKTVGGDILNGVIEKELRINDKGLELVTTNHSQQVRMNGPIASNGTSATVTVKAEMEDALMAGVKRPATPDNTPAKRIALEDPRAPPGSDSRITLYVSQNGNECGEVISQGQQVILNQGQQQQFTVVSQGQQQPHQAVVVSQGMSSGPVVTTQTVVTPQGQQVIIQRPSSQGGVLVPPGGQILAQSPSGQVIQQVIQQGTSGQPQKVILHQGQLGQVLGGQVIISQGGSQSGPVVVQGPGNNIQGPVIMQGVPTSNHGQIVVTGSQGQSVVVPGTQGQTMLVGGGQGQTVVMSSQGTGQAGQVMVQGNQVGGTVLLAQPSQQQGSTAKTFIILPNPKMVLSGSQHGQQGQIVLPRQMAGQQVVQVATTGTSGNLVTTSMVQSTTTGVRTVLAGAPFSDNRTATPTPPSVQHGTCVVQNSSVGTPVPQTTVSHNTSTPSCLPMTVAPAPAGPTAVPVAHAVVKTSTAQTPQIPAPKVLASGVVRRPAGTSTGLQYLCEWRGCNQSFTTPGQVYTHACKIHCPPHLTEVQCQWNGCDSMTRKRFSAMTHLNDRHCGEQLLQILAVRRQQVATTGKSDIVVPQPPPPHPGYAPNAAFHAIKRHALEVINQRDAVEKEGPVTKSIRLTSALILRNLVIYSNISKKLMRAYESELANVALSTMESSRTVAQILYDIRLPDHQDAL